MGQPGKYTFCAAEHEAANPWEPFHVWRGYRAEESTVTVVGAAGSLEVLDAASETAASLLTVIARSMTIAGALGASNLLGGGEPLVLLAPEHATIIGRECDRRQVQRALFEQARLPLDAFGAEIVAQVRRSRGADDPGAPVRVAERPEDVMLAVIGGVGAKSTYIPTWAGTTRAVTRTIDLE
jgi:hypothetical protein